MGPLDDYLASVSHCLRAPDYGAGTELAALLSLSEAHGADRSLHYVDVDRPVLRRHLRPPWDSLVGLHIRALRHVHCANWAEAFAAQWHMVTGFAREVMRPTKEGNWFLPLCYTLCVDLRHCAKRADRLEPAAICGDGDKLEGGAEGGSGGGGGEESASSHLEKAAGPVTACYRECVTDNRLHFESSKKFALLNLTNQLFRIYFKIGKLNLLKPLIRTMNNCREFDAFAVQDRITYRFYVGRKAMFDSDLAAAEENLSWSLRHTPLRFHKHRRLILTYLIPVKMFLGHMPTEGLMRKYELMQFHDVAVGVRHGDLVALERALHAHEHFFIQCGIFLMLEKLKVLAYRTLFKRVCTICGSHQVKLDYLLAALRLMHVTDVDADELACILANLIYQQRIKGYISHKHQTLVVSKVKPFPPLADVSALS